MDFGDEYPSRFSTFRGTRGRDDEIPLEGSFGLGFVNKAFVSEDTISGSKTPIWQSNDDPRIPRWNTSDSLKDAIQSLDDLTNRLNSEDNISAVTNLSRDRRSLKSNKSNPTTPREDLNDTQSEQSYMNYNLTNGATQTVNTENTSVIQNYANKTVKPVDHNPKNTEIVPPVDYPDYEEVIKDNPRYMKLLTQMEAGKGYVKYNPLSEDKDNDLEVNAIVEQSTAF